MPRQLLPQSFEGQSVFPLQFHFARVYHSDVKWAKDRKVLYKVSAREHILYTRLFWGKIERAKTCHMEKELSPDPTKDS